MTVAMVVIDTQASPWNAVLSGTASFGNLSAQNASATLGGDHCIVFGNRDSVVALKTPLALRCFPLGLGAARRSRWQYLERIAVLAPARIVRRAVAAGKMGLGATLDATESRTHVVSLSQATI
jgi:hypothetical protein